MFKYLRIISKIVNGLFAWIITFRREQLSKSELDNKNAVDVDCTAQIAADDSLNKC